MELNVDNAKQQLQETLNQLVDFFSRLGTDEIVAFSLIGIGFFLLLVGIMML